MQNAAMAALGLNWRYLAFDVHPDNLKEAIDGAKAMKYVGLNLTVPHKLLAVPMVDLLDASARDWGAVNTIRFEALDEKGNWTGADSPDSRQTGTIRSHGFNTDADAMVQSLREDLEMGLAQAKVLLLGAGGAGRVAALKLAAEGVSELFLINRTAKKAGSLAAEIRERFPDVKVTTEYPPGSIDLVLNATSLGLDPADPLPFNEQAFSLRKTKAVFDMIYRPAETPLLKKAKAAGCRTANGLSMLLYQGAKALEIWTGRQAPAQIMRTALEKNLYA
jgi:shikimate dehydrogenase